MEEILNAWLDKQCKMLVGTQSAVLITGPQDEGPYDRHLYWPQPKAAASVLVGVAEAALRLKQAVVKSRYHEVEETGEPLDALACPLFMDQRLIGAIALDITHQSRTRQHEAVGLLQTGAKWLETMLMQHGLRAKEQLAHLVDLVVAGTEPTQFAAAAAEVTNELAERFDCQRVSLGFLHFNRVRLAAMSHSNTGDQPSNLSRAIGDAMSEALDQAASINFPAATEQLTLATRFHDQLSKMLHGAAILTIPLIKNRQVVGALLMERSQDRPFLADTQHQCEQIGLLLGPVLETRRSDERPLAIKVLEAIRSGLSRCFGPRHLALKLVAITVIALLAWLFTFEAPMHISSDSILEASVRRVVVAPQQGFIGSANVRAGDLVNEGDLMATLDERQLLIEQRRWQSQRAQLLKEYRKALAGSNRAEVAILNAKRGQAEAQLNLVHQQLQRLKLIAPFSGLVVKGDLSQALGSPVERGEVLFEVAPTDQYRVVINIDDRDIGLVRTGQKGELKLSGIPDRDIGITVDRLTPVSTSENGRNFFRVEAVLESHSDLMRPGMGGIAKIEAGRDKLLWIWTRRFVNWLRLTLWQRLP